MFLIAKVDVGAYERSDVALSLAGNPSTTTETSISKRVNFSAQPRPSLDSATPRSMDQFVSQANRNRLQLIMFIKNHMQIAQEDEYSSDVGAEQLTGSSEESLGNGLYIDNSKFNKQK